MNITVLSVGTGKNNKTEYSQELVRAFEDKGNKVSFAQVPRFIPALDRKMKKLAKGEPDFIVVAEVLGKTCEKDFKKLFAGIIYRGERLSQEVNDVIAQHKSLQINEDKPKVKRTLPDKIKRLFDTPDEEIPKVKYNRKKVQIFTLEAEDKTAYTFNYMGVKTLVLQKGISAEFIPQLVESAQARFEENSEQFPDGYRLIPREYSLLNFAQRNIPQKRDTGNEKIRKSVAILAMLVFVASAGLFIYNRYVLPIQNDAIQSDIQTIFYEDEDSGGKEAEIKKRNWAKIKKINKEIVGWINIDYTKIDYPILQHKGDNADSQYYLYRNYKQQSSGFGSIFLDYRSTKGMNSKNVIIHGHHMDDGSMFAGLMKYGTRGGGDTSFYKKSPIIKISTPKGTETYKIFSVFKSNVNPAQGEYFDFYCGSFESDAQFMNYVYNLRIRSLLNCPVSVNEDDQILTLVTCSYEFEDFRTAVVARKCRKGESTEVDVNRVSMNHQAIWPQCYYSRYGSSRPAISTFQTALKENKIDWYDGDFKLKGNEELPTTVTEPATEKEVKVYTVKVYNRGKLIRVKSVKEGKAVKLPKIKKTYTKGKYKYTFKGWRSSKGANYKNVQKNMSVAAEYKKTKISVSKPKPTKATKPTKPKATKPKATKPTQKPTKPVETTAPTETVEQATDAEE